MECETERERARGTSHRKRHAGGVWEGIGNHDKVHVYGVISIIWSNAERETERERTRGTHGKVCVRQREIER